MVRLMIKHPLSSPRFHNTVIPTSDPLKIRLKQILITENSEKKHHHHHHHHRSGVKKSKHGHKHEHSGRKSLDLSLRLGLSGKDQDAMSTATSTMDKIKNLGVYTRQQEDEDKFYGVSTKLALFDYRL